MIFIDERSESLGVRELVTALFREIYFAALIWDGINSVIKSGNKLPHSTCEFRNSQKIKTGIDVLQKESYVIK
ncbi:MAG: hypothetical protein A2X45_14800 [Lentisphaerae bacterium GWF2_50_93]|nr:MAG: hypothetical protein A2X45_14800 [Lentisphaerae bacterium GWF2_50_93]